jgi:broad specificity phosphatase PhoE
VRFDRGQNRFSVTTFLLIRHAMCDPVGKSIAGREPGLHLNETGEQQARNLAEQLRPLCLKALYSSPLERALETARPLAITQGLEIQTAAGLTEVDFGDWTGKSLAELDQLPGWREFNQFRSRSRIPGGESMAEVLTRSLRELERLKQFYPGPGTLVALVSHGDVLRTLMTHALGMPADFIHRLELSPASVTILELEDYGARVLLMNKTEGWPTELPRRTSR